ncbi:hypothetical protein [Streptomyces venezuelae]|uniref:Uncharacterized protein n=1 Tax=Streptomyces venezuelae TaxID=54571 RepID=A0A5P2B5Q6_STRVZ|nr:hypothetical protein [Streptomyces venezuelae]QES25902.1 hypothetical protein DEJ47_05010 [Streptomyces venezuelae]
MTRPSTPDRINADGSKTIKMKRACNGCGKHIGDVTDEEMAAAMNGRPLPDVRRECPACGPTAPPPVCMPTQIVEGGAYCVIRDCNHEVENDGDYCDQVSEKTVCATHSTFASGFEESYEVVTVSAPWPCTKGQVV